MFFLWLFCEAAFWVLWFLWMFDLHSSSVLRRPLDFREGPFHRALALVVWEMVWDTGFWG